MHRVLSLLAVGFVLGPGAGQAQDKAPSAALGLQLSAVPEVLYYQVPILPQGHGLLVVRVAPDSPAARAGVLRHDVLLSVDGRKLDKSNHLEYLIAKQAQHKVSLKVLRAGKEMTLSLFPAVAAGPKALLKPGGPPAVSIEAKTLEGKRLSVTFTFFANGTGKLERVTCSGSLDEIKQQVKDLGRENRMSAPVQDLADLALDRIRVLNSPAKK